MNKLLPFTWLLLFSLCGLAACGGGGSGGGGGIDVGSDIGIDVGSGGNIDVGSGGDIDGDIDVGSGGGSDGDIDVDAGQPPLGQAPHAFSDVLNYLQTDSNYVFYRDGDTIVMRNQLPAPNDKTLLDRSDFALDDDGYWKVEKYKPDDDSAKLLTIYLGGKKAGLEYSDFGFWINYAAVTSNSGPSISTSWFYDPAQVAPLPADNELTFKGSAIALLSNSTCSEYILKGEATFHISNGLYSLTLDFADFYSFDFNMTNAPGDTPGKFIAAGLPTMSKGNSSAPVPTSGSFYSVLTRAYAQFVGASGGPASEGVGHYMINYISQTPSDKFFLQGAYGVKIVP